MRKKILNIHWKEIVLMVIIIVGTRFEFVKPKLSVSNFKRD
jgi:hypothetical protein